MKDWVVLDVAPDQLLAEMIQEMLNDQGIASLIEPHDTMSFLGVSSRPCRVMVRPDQLESARAIVAEDNQTWLGGPEP